MVTNSIVEETELILVSLTQRMDEDQRRRLEEGIEQLKENKIQHLNLSCKCLDSLLLRKLISLQDNNIGDEVQVILESRGFSYFDFLKE